VKYKLLITTSGLGSRLGNVTKYTNKALAKIGDKAAICYIVEKYPKDVEIVVTLGYFGDHVKDFLEIAYPDRTFYFVRVDNYDGPGSSLVYSLLCAKSYIDSPFVFHACDTLITDESIPEPSNNWLGLHNSKDSTNYVTVETRENMVTQLFNKGQGTFDAIYIGLAGVFDYKDFFQYADKIYQKKRMDRSLSDVHVHSMLLKNGMIYNCQYFSSWLDVGNMDKLRQAKERYQTKDIEVLEKDTEAIYLIDDKIIKFFSDINTASHRVKRAKILDTAVPNIIAHKNNFYAYPYVQGELFSRVVNETTMRRFLAWSKNHLWKKLGEKNVVFSELCYNFYF
jgi:NDP-sugar pyrophosphorylase family protein